MQCFVECAFGFCTVRPVPPCPALPHHNPPTCPPTHRLPCSNLEWALGRVRALSGAARDLEPGSARARLEAQRAAWERAAMLRLHKGARVLGGC